MKNTKTENTENKHTSGKLSDASTCSIYSFSTFQELVDKVPSDKIAECMAEMGQAFAQGKLLTELAIETARAQGKLLGELPERVITLPESFDWMDDGKGEVGVNLKVSKDSEESVRITTKMHS